MKTYTLTIRANRPPTFDVELEVNAGFVTEDEVDEAIEVKAQELKMDGYLAEWTVTEGGGYVITDATVNDDGTHKSLEFDNAMAEFTAAMPHLVDSSPARAQDRLDRLIAMAMEDLDLEGEYTADSANQRCERYAKLVMELRHVTK